MIMKLLIPLILQLVGVAVIIAEFIVPTAGILAMVSIGIFGYSIYYVFANVSASAGITFIIVDLLMIPVLVVIGFKMLASSSATLRNSLVNKEGVVSQPEEWAAIVGKEGTAQTALHPSGSAMIEGIKYDVVSKGDFIEKGKRIIVVTIDGNRIVVKKSDT
jgi:membrane-bound ClpP family serine protease